MFPRSPQASLHFVFFVYTYFVSLLRSRSSGGIALIFVLRLLVIHSTLFAPSLHDFDVNRLDFTFDEHSICHTL